MKSNTCGSCPQSREVGLRVPTRQKAAWLVPASLGAGRGQGGQQADSFWPTSAGRLDCSYIKRAILETQQSMASHPLRAQPVLRSLFLPHSASATLGVFSEPLTPLLEFTSILFPSPLHLPQALQPRSGPHSGVQIPVPFREPGSVPEASDTENKTWSLHAGSQGGTCPCHLSASQTSIGVGPVEGRELGFLL